jgi:hypothetical protein
MPRKEAAAIKINKETKKNLSPIKEELGVSWDELLRILHESYILKNEECIIITYDDDGYAHA